MFNVREKQEREQLQRSFFLTFNNINGKNVLEYLNQITLNKTLPSSATKEELYFLEGQRNLVKLIQNLSK